MKSYDRRAEITVGWLGNEFHFLCSSLRWAIVIMGEHWLKALRKFQMNLDKLFMTFQRRGPLITIPGLQAGVDELISSHKVGKQLAKGEL